PQAPAIDQPSPCSDATQCQSGGLVCLEKGLVIVNSESPARGCGGSLRRCNARPRRTSHHQRRVWQGDTGIDRFGHFAVLTATLRENKSTDDRSPMQPHFLPWPIAHRTPVVL